LVLDVNNQEESNKLADELHSLAIVYGTILLLILHENPDENTQKPRGHLGSQLERKSEANIRIVKDEHGIGSIYTERSRHALEATTKASQSVKQLDNRSVLMSSPCGLREMDSGGEPTTDQWTADAFPLPSQHGRTEGLAGTSSRSTIPQS
jgi:hypothetical protein